MSAATAVMHVDRVAVSILDSFESSESIRYPTGSIQKAIEVYPAINYIAKHRVVAGISHRGGGQIQ